MLATQKQQNSSRYNQALSTGEQWSMLCSYCHGEKGISQKGAIPHLAGQNPQYLITQFELFVSGKRKDLAMQQVAARMSPEDRVDVALFYASQSPVRGISTRPELTTQGQKLYQQQCAACHGSNGEGKQDIPALAKQSEAYLVQTLQRFASADSSRKNSAMIGIARLLKADDINAVSAYLTAL
jgi:cytochrome c553